MILKPKKNTEGNDTYKVKSIGELLILCANLDDVSRKQLIDDVVIGLNKAAAQDALRDTGIKGKMVRALVRASPLVWINDDKGKVTVTLAMREGEEPFFKKDL